MPTPMEYARAAAQAARKGDAEAAAYFRQKATEGYNAEVPKATEGMSGVEKFTAGMGQGAVNLGRQAGNILGLKGYSDEALQEAARVDQALLDTGAGKAGALTGEILATAPVGGAVGALGKTALRGGTAARLLTGAAGQGAAEGALTAGPGNRGAGAAVGAAGGVLLPKAIRGAGSLLARGVRPTAPAKALLREGVDLTPGQMNPRSAFGQLEEAATNVWGVGPLIQDAREAAMGDWRKAARAAALPPGARRETANGSLESVYQAYEPAYDVAKGFPTAPRIMRTAGSDTPLASFPQVRGAFEAAARDPNIRADDATRKAAHKWLQNKLTQLPGKGRTGTVDSADLLKLRSEIRAEIRAAGKGQNPDMATVSILSQAEQSITDALESQLPRQATDALKATDAQYAQYKILEDAVRRSGDQISGTTPSQLSAAVKAATPASQYARGGGGPLRKLASSGKQVFDVRTPPTGARLATLGTAVGLGAAAPAVGIPLGVAGVLAATTKSGRKLLAGGTKAQQAAQRYAAALRRKVGRGGRRFGEAAATATGAVGATNQVEE